MKRVLHVVSGDLYAGAERIVEELAIAQRTHLGMSVGAAVLNPGRLAEQLRAAGIDVQLLDERRLGAFALVKDLRALVKRQAPDIVHTHRFKENIVGGIAAARLAPSVRTVHGAPEFSRARNLRDRVIEGLDRFAARHLQSAVVCVSEELSTRMGAAYGAAHLTTVINGIDGGRLRAAAAADVGPLAGKICVGMFARLVPVKRIDVAMDVVGRVRQRTGLDLVLHVFGDGPLEKALRARGADRADVVFHGNTDIAPAYMRCMDALLMTSSHEGLPVSVLEAMALSVPVVATRTGGIPAVLAQGDCGWLADANDPAAYEQALIEAVTVAPPRETRIAAALQRFEQVFSARRMAEDYNAVYAQAVRGAPRSAVVSA